VASTLDELVAVRSEDLLLPEEGMIGTLFRLDDWRAQKIGLQGLWFTPLATKAGKRIGRREYICEVDGPAR
jgi:hypothetical protein